MSNQKLVEAANLLRQATGVVMELSNIDSPIIQNAALDDTVKHVERVVDIALDTLRGA